MRLSNGVRFIIEDVICDFSLGFLGGSYEKIIFFKGGGALESILGEHFGLLKKR